MMRQRGYDDGDDNFVLPRRTVATAPKLVASSVPRPLEEVKSLRLRLKGTSDLTERAALNEKIKAIYKTL